ncbi:MULTISPECIES: DoxX family protein [Providencia]|uniref:Putative membrane protein n=1 Tax=Providencia heimbachae ATCC 35613 TaxID=1354272 RepID=A0A1B7JRB7_9GAMM|nr:MULTISPECIES: DoxX family protein [Providencia]MBP6123934.1 DoxX family protein [Providencia sp.]MDD9339321.1 DoxX family protein [Providencia heimbachae]NIH21212.1 DoxX family protein [Providencia heimbachae]OAT50459.1 putative membrane protein [Providencia heimbachae ATCC 35613]QCJ68815.1 DoxX family protein [Providencia heimbachae]
MIGLFNRLLSHDDAGKLLLRFAVGGLMLFHGMSKLMTGASGIKALLASYGLPEFIAYGSIAGEVIAPIFIVLGILTRPSALLVAFTMFVAWLMIGLDKTFLLDKTGAWAIESLVYFFISAIALAFMGSGKYSVMRNACWR